MTDEEIDRCASVGDLVRDVWDVHGERRLFESARKRAADGGHTEPAVESALTRLPEVSALAALRANRRVVDLLTGWRWSAMRDAREEGRSWSEIGAALGMTKQGAWDFYRKAIDNQERFAADYHDAEPARAALGSPDDDGPDRRDGNGR